MKHSCSILLLGFALLVPATEASAEGARVDGLGGVDLFTEDASDVFLNPAHAGSYANRAWFSLGLTGAGEVLGVDPHGGASVRIKDRVTIGLALNRSPQLYGFGNALWPVVEQYIAGGPGGELSGPEGPVAVTAPLRFPVDFVFGVGDSFSKVRFGANIYYAFGVERDWSIDDSDQDDLESQLIANRQSHLFNATLGMAFGTRADRIRPEFWLRVGNLSAWQDQVQTTETDGGTTDTNTDQILALDRALRVGGGFRLGIGDTESGVVVMPGLRYDLGSGAYRFDDNLVSPDSSAENATRDSLAHHLRIGSGLAWRGGGLLVQGSASLVLTHLQVIDGVDGADDNRLQTRTETLGLLAPEVSIGAEYRLLPFLLVRAGLRSAVGGGQSMTTINEAIGPEASLADFSVEQALAPADPALHVVATGGLGLHVNRFTLDAIVGGLLLGNRDGRVDLFSRIDLSFSFD